MNPLLSNQPKGCLDTEGKHSAQWIMEMNENKKEAGTKISQPLFTI